jgi:hypothetical protein
MRNVSRLLASGLGALLASLILLSFLYRCCFEYSGDLLFTILVIWGSIYLSIFSYEWVTRGSVGDKDGTLQGIGIALICALIIFVCFLR